MSARLVTDQRRAGRAGRHLHRAGPRRRAVPAGAAGDPRPADRHRGRDPRPPTRARARPRHDRRIGHPAELLADLDVIDASLRANGSALLADDRLARLREAVRRLRVPPVRTGHAAELRGARGGGRRAAGLGRRASRLPVAARAGPGRAAGRRAGHPAAAGRAWRGAVGAGRARNSTSSHAAARAVQVFGPEAVPNYIISMCQSVSDMLEAAILLKEAGLLDASGEHAVLPGGHRAAVRDHRRSAARLGDPRSGAGPSAVPGAGACAR